MFRQISRTPTPSRRSSYANSLKLNFITIAILCFVLLSHILSCVSENSQADSSTGNQANSAISNGHGINHLDSERQKVKHVPEHKTKNKITGKKRPTSKGKYQSNVKYETDTGRKHVENSPTFKSKKASLIWAKALKKYQYGHEDQSKLLNSLVEDLTTIDKQLIELKHLKFDGKDPYGEEEDRVESAIQDLLEKYELKKKSDGVKEPMSNRIEDYVNRDNRLEEMYKKAQSLGFSDAELNDLKKEIFHHKRTMAELDDLVGNLKALEDEARLSSNDVDDVSDSYQQEAKQLKIQEVQTAIKKKKREVKEGYSRLSVISDNPGLPNDATFTQPKVLKLWVSILKANFTPEERYSLKEELMHLEKKMNKRDKLEEEKAMLEKHEKLLHPSHSARKEKYSEKKEKVDQKAQHLEKHVHKYIKDIDRRVLERQHTEL
ncbi:hypothetical protein EB796_015570 [Bugula neritina]|uniref:Alpha-2-macroglobulin receptor-associated protein n=1 Tax=Bugula neritina TaxID=10212 RepID=A0A7J7JIH4_BUGNE|nr:hypothetical protein EB796_015570 [Bugula neritina]